MIRHCIITPTKFINDPLVGWRSDFILALSHLLDVECTNKYAQALRSSWKDIYLDNGTFENGVPEDHNSLLRKAKLIDAKYVFASDYLYDDERSKEALERMAQIRNLHHLNIKLGYVVQAKTIEWYLKNYKRAEQNPDIDLIGISILTIPYCRQESTWTPDITYNRIQTIETIDNEIHPKKDAHLLWLGGSLLDLKKATFYPWIKSNDSCSAFMTWLYGKVYEDMMVPWGKIKQKVDFDYHYNLDETQQKCITENIDTILSITHTDDN